MAAASTATTPSPTIINTTITGNSASAGGGLYCYGGSPIIANSTIAVNSGGGIYCYSSSPTIANTTITGNSASSGGGVYCSDSLPTIINTIITFNSSGVYLTGWGVPVLRDNCVYGNTAYNYSGVTDPTGTLGNISADPKLADVLFGNVHIQPDSPCRDAGDDALVQAGWRDMDGQSRIQGAHVDIGADESDGTIWPASPYAVVRVSPNGNDGNDGSSWVLAKQTVQAGIDSVSASGGEVWVRTGVYNERITLRGYAYIYGGFAGTEDSRDHRDWRAQPTVLDGQASGSVVTVLTGRESQHHRRLHDSQRQGCRRRRALLLLLLPDHHQHHDHGQLRLPRRRSLLPARVPDDRQHHDHGKHRLLRRRALRLWRVPDHHQHHDHGKQWRRHLLRLLLPDDHQHDHRVQLIGGL